MRKVRNAWLCVAVVLTLGCHHTTSLTGRGDGGTDAAANPDSIAGGSLVITPVEVTLDVTYGAVAPTQAYAAHTAGGTDVTADAAWSVDDTTLGSFAGATFTPAAIHGGTSFVRATWQGLEGYATIHVRFHAVVSSDNCPGCPTFPPDATEPCSASVTVPTVIYPPDGTLVPPNMNVLQTQFDQGQGTALFEIDYQNALTDVRVLTRCTAITDTKGNATNACAYDLSQQVWDFVALTNRGGDPLNVIVRATDENGTCIATSTSQVAIAFAQEDLNGGIYYWQSVEVTGLQGATGGIFRYDFGVRGQSPTAFLAPSSAGGTNTQRCIGCHFLSRDGVKMTYNNDDPDADDEYGDVKSALLDVATKAAVNLGKPGFQAFAPDHSVFLASDGLGKLNPAAFYLFNGDTGAAATPATISSGTGRGTQPDWSPDGARVVFVQPAGFDFPTSNRIDDNHFFGGSLAVMTASGSTFGAPTVLLASSGENNFYPAFSPDGTFVIFNRVALQGTASACTAGSCPNDAFSNPRARVLLMPAAGGTPVDLVRLNAVGELENSWPRFAPQVQTYKGHQIAWVTFASTRDYGAVVRNSQPIGGNPQHICYPPESPENTSTNKNVTGDPICMQPQLWMAAIDLTAAATGADASYPAFWLPFQEPNAHNHIAQWVTTLVGPPPSGDGGADGPSCIPGFGSCQAGDVCCNGTCCTDGTCGCIP